VHCEVDGSVSVDLNEPIVFTSFMFTWVGFSRWEKFRVDKTESIMSTSFMIRCRGEFGLCKAPLCQHSWLISVHAGLYSDTCPRSLAQSRPGCSTLELHGKYSLHLCEQGKFQFPLAKIYLYNIFLYHYHVHMDNYDLYLVIGQEAGVSLGSPADPVRESAVL
jgi:hypothetical protein